MFYGLWLFGILLQLFVGPQYLDPPEEYGVAVNFGTTDVGSGSKPLSQPREAVTEEVVEESQPQEAEVTPTEPAESTPQCLSSMGSWSFTFLLIRSLELGFAQAA